MSPADLALLLEGLEEAIKLEPQIQTALVNLFSKPNPTPADWTALRVAALSKNYRDYVPETQLPLSLTPPAAVAADTSAAANTAADTSAVSEVAPVAAASTLGHVSPMA